MEEQWAWGEGYDEKCGGEKVQGDVRRGKLMMGRGWDEWHIWRGRVIRNGFGMRI